MYPFARWMARTFAPSSERRTRTTRRPKLGLEALESREVPSVTAYDRDFEPNKTATLAPGVTAAWSQTGKSTSPSGQTFLGEFGNQTVTLNLNNLPSHNQLTVEFDLYLIRSWDGNDPVWGGPNGDRWSLKADGATLLDTTFRTPRTLPTSNYGQEFGGQGVTDPGPFAPGTGAAAVNTLGYTFNGGNGVQPLNAIYHFSYPINHTGSSLTLAFAGSGLQGLSDESWGLDNVKVVSDTLPAVTAVDDGYSIGFGQTLSIPASDGVLKNDLANGGPSLTAVAATGTTAHGGSYTLSADGSFTYTPPTGYAGADSFTYTATNGTTTSSPATVAFTVLSSLSGRMWYDTNGNGIQDSGEASVEDMGGQVQLYDANGFLVSADLIGYDEWGNYLGNGQYLFTQLMPGVSYSLRFIAPADMAFTLRDQGTDDTHDSDADSTTGTFANVAPALGQTLTEVDAGIVGTVLLAWTQSESDPTISKFLIPLVAGSATPIPYTGDRNDFGAASVTVDWNDPDTDNSSATAPEFYAEGSYAVSVTNNLSGQPTVTTFSIQVTEADAESSSTEEDVPVQMESELFITLSWSGIEDATSFTITRAIADNPGEPTYLGMVNTQGYSDDSVVVGVSYVYTITANFSDGSSYSFDAIGEIAAPPGEAPTTTPHYVRSRSGGATQADDAKALAGVTIDAKLRAAKGKSFFISVYNIDIFARMRGNNRIVVATGSGATITMPAKDSRGQLFYSDTYEGGLNLLKLKAFEQRAPVLIGANSATTTLQDGTVLTITKDGDWATFTVARVGEKATDIRIECPIRNLQVVSPNRNTEIDRIDRLKVIVENKDARGLQLKENRKPDGSYRFSPAEWALEHIYTKTVNRIETIRAATAVNKQGGQHKYVGPTNAPSIADLRNINDYVFEIQGDWPELRAEVNRQIKRLQQQYPASDYKYTFSAKYAM